MQGVGAVLEPASEGVLFEDRQWTNGFDAPDPASGDDEDGDDGKRRANGAAPAEASHGDLLADDGI